MALLDLSLITKTVVNLLEQRLPLFADWPASATLEVSPAPPDAVSGDYALSFYLYHLREDAYTKGQDWETNDGTPQRYKPMGLTLNYVLCPRSNMAQPAKRAYADQLVMGLAVKTLHDYPVIDDNTMIDLGLGGMVQALPLALRGQGNRLRISLRPVAVEESSQYWQSGTQAMRMAAYFEISAALLEPEVLQTRAGRVLGLGVHAQTRGRPVIDTTRNTVQFNIPGDPSLHEVDIAPAEVAYGQPFSVLGSELGNSQSQLLIGHADFAAPVVADAAWGLAGNGTVLTATAQPTASAQALLPGIYSVQVRTVDRVTLPDGSQRDFDSISNPAPLAIAPRISAISFGGGGLGTLMLDGFDPSALGSSDLQCYAGASKLTRVAAAPAAGQFWPRSGPNRIEFKLPAGITTGSLVPLRVIVRGAESGPNWGVAP
ncbi:Protein of unknown function [Andreprevotia lacus DSM 23236]|jgi:hypothetical protein|uniref:Pvc16 N-terminal domain-containing protein n=1 Tax=Andreprevotia lacus DSM 23236 TaxID=1121001 RepID=A0A1W1X710_9NEIS|nr:DUF4255 domain-containing protein [Andreprevotia lacus]SMC19732.1 Protein of unknown function [Andreprevotia lacus DSM 23236]